MFGHRGGLGDLEDQPRGVDVRRGARARSASSSRGSPIERPDRLTSSGDVVPGGAGARRAWSIARRATQRSISPIRSSARRRRGSRPAGSASPSASRMRSSSSYWSTAPGAQVDDRLGVQREAVLVERVADLRRPTRAAPVDARLSASVPSATGEAVAARPPWRRTSRGRRRRARRRARQPSVPSNRAMPMLAVTRLRVAGDCEHGLARGPPRAARRRPPAPRRAPPSGSSTANSSPPSRASMSVGAERSRSTWATPHDQLVAGAVAERVVDVLEVVEVEHQQPRRARRSARPARRGARARARTLRRLSRPVSGSWSARWRSCSS